MQMEQTDKFLENFTNSVQILYLRLFRVRAKNEGGKAIRRKREGRVQREEVCLSNFVLHSQLATKVVKLFKPYFQLRRHSMQHCRSLLYASLNGTHQTGYFQLPKSLGHSQLTPLKKLSQMRQYHPQHRLWSLKNRLALKSPRILLTIEKDQREHRGKGSFVTWSHFKINWNIL